MSAWICSAQNYYQNVKFQYKSKTLHLKQVTIDNCFRVVMKGNIPHKKSGTYETFPCGKNHAKCKKNVCIASSVMTKENFRALEKAIGFLWVWENC